MPADNAFPALTGCARLFLGDSPEEAPETLFDLKFYPYPTVDNDNIFAVTGCRDVFICRPKLDADTPYEILAHYQDEDEDVAYNSLVWTIDPTTHRPLICVAGSSPKQIKILDAFTGTPVRCLPGHGKAINDLAVSPLATHLLASASADYTIRLWDLRPEAADHPCVAIFSGCGHKQPILAIAFHPNGRWLLSGGQDTAICLWSMPSLDSLEASRATNPQSITTIFFPHFVTTEVHDNYIDSLAFYGSYILSRSARNNGIIDNEIILWRVDGFDAYDPPPDDTPVPEPQLYTRSAFPHSDRSRGFHRLLSFSIPHTDRFYHRFTLLHQPGMRPILSMGTQKSEFRFWDLQKLEEGWDPAEEKKKTGRGKGWRGGKKGKHNINSENLTHLDDIRSDSVASAETSLAGASTPLPSSISTPADRLGARHYSLSDPFTPLAAHARITPKTKLSFQPAIGRVRKAGTRDFATSQMAWSPDGCWLIAAGDLGMMTFFHRDEGVVGTVKAGGAVQKGVQQIPE